MDATRYWPVTIEGQDGEPRTVVVAYPIRPSEDLAAGLALRLLGLCVQLPPEYQYVEDGSLRALEAAGYKLIEIGEGSC